MVDNHRDAYLSDLRDIICQHVKQKQFIEIEDVRQHLEILSKMSPASDGGRKYMVSKFKSQLISIHEELSQSDSSTNCSVSSERQDENSNEQYEKSSYGYNIHLTEDLNALADLKNSTSKEILKLPESIEESIADINESLLTNVNFNTVLSDSNNGGKIDVKHVSQCPCKNSDENLSDCIAKRTRYSGKRKRMERKCNSCSPNIEYGNTCSCKTDIKTNCQYVECDIQSNLKQYQIIADKKQNFEKTKNHQAQKTIQSADAIFNCRSAPFQCSEQETINYPNKTTVLDILTQAEKLEQMIDNFRYSLCHKLNRYSEEKFKLLVNDEQDQFSSEGKYCTTINNTKDIFNDKCLQDVSEILENEYNNHFNRGSKEDEYVSAGTETIEIVKLPDWTRYVHKY